VHRMYNQEVVGWADSQVLLYNSLGQIVYISASVAKHRYVQVTAEL